VLRATLSSKCDIRLAIEVSVPCNLVSSDENEHCISESSEWKSTDGELEWPVGIHSPGCQFLSGDSFTVVTRL
jgi:hypothetical protein